MQYFNLNVGDEKMPDDEPKFRFRDLHPISKGIFFIIIILAVIGSISNDPIVFGGNIAKIAISFAIGWFITGPVCWEWAYKKDRNTDFAFLFGFFLSIPGAILYWIYQLFFKKKPDNLEVQHISSERKPKFCTTCGVPLQFENADICPNCGVKIQAQPIPGKSGLFWLSVVLAVLLIIGTVITTFVFGVAGLTQKVSQSDGTNTPVNTPASSQTYISPSSTSDSIQVSGNGNGVKPFTVTGTGLSEFSMSYSGQQNFIVRLRDSEGKYIELLANEIGSYSGKKTATLRTGKYVLDITASGPWTIDISSI